MRRLACRGIRVCTVVLLAALGAAPGTRAAQDEAPQVAPAAGAQAPAEPDALADFLQGMREGEPTTLVFENREIVPLRMVVLGRTPAERAAHARAALDRLADEGVTGPVTARAVHGGVLVFVAETGVFGFVDGDIAGWTDEQRAAAGASVVRSLELALAEAVELRTPGRLLRAVLRASVATLLLALVVRLLVLLSRAVRRSIEARDAASAIRDGAPVDLAKFGLRRVAGLLMRLARGALLVVGLVVSWIWLTFVLLQFPYLRPLGESLDENLRGLLLRAFDATLLAIPDLAVATVILLLARLVVRRSNAMFLAVQQGRARMPFVEPEVAQATRRIVAFLLWVFALVLAFPYLPGSDTAAFRGMTVFLGVLISLGSTGVVGQALAGLMVMYARILHVGDYVRVGEAEGSVTEIGLLTTRLRSVWGEELTLPNSLLLGQSTCNYSRFAREGGVMLRSKVSIGYDTPWRQVHALLLRAAERTPGVSRLPRPYVLQSSLADWYVIYELNAAVDVPADRIPVLSALHENVQDEFNTHGVQIMSPTYLARASAPVVVPPENWNAPPAGEAPGR